MLDNRSYMLLGDSSAISPAAPGHPLAPTQGGQYLGLMYYTPLVKESYYTVHLQSITIQGEALPGDLPCSAYNAPGQFLYLALPFTPICHPHLSGSFIFSVVRAAS